MSRESKTVFSTSNPPPFDTMGLFTFLRTYARRHDEEDPNSTVETWQETLERVIKACDAQLQVGFTEEEEKDLFNLLYNLKCSVAGRFLWQLGTQTVNRLGLPSMQNCSFVIVDEPIRPFTWTMNFLMLGCVPAETPILTEGGIMPISDVKIGDKVWSYNTKTDKKELKPVTRLHDPIVTKDMNIKLICKYGSILCSKKHPILSWKNGKWDYVLTGEIKKGDIVQKFTHDLSSEVIFDQKAWFVGAFLGDGCSNVLEQFGSRRIRFVKNDEQFVQKFADVISALSGETTVCKKSIREDYKTDMWSVEKTLHRDNPLVSGWDKLVGKLPSRKTKVLDIPEWIKTTSDKNIFMSFLTGLVDTDGTISTNKVSISTISERLYNSLQQYSSLFGIYPWTHIQKVEKQNLLQQKRNTGYIAKSDTYVVTYRSRDFKAYINFLQNPQKKTALSDDLFRPRKKQYSRKELIIPPEMVAAESKKLGLDKTSWHFQEKLKETGYIGSGYYESRNESFDHLLQYDIVTDIEDDLDIDENWKDITVEDNNNYFCGEDSFYCTHNCGVGYRLLPDDVEKLPPIKYALVTRKDTKDADFIVPDSREGWVKLLGKTLKAHFYSGQSFTYSCTLLRSKGAPIKSFGGVASGPDVLCDGIDKISSVLNKRVGQKIRSVDALDIMNIIGMIVVSGNVRRSAQIAIGSVHDKEFLQAKRWDLGNIPNWRAYSNNSVVCDDIKDVIDNKDFWLGYEGTGEPYGLINLKLARSCGRLGEYQYPDPELQGFNPCITGDSLILTTDGLKPVIELVGKQFTAVVNGKEYLSTEKGFWKTGTLPVYYIKLQNGEEIRATGNHKFSVGLDQWKEVKDMQIGENIVICDNHNYRWSGGEGTFQEGYFVGQLIGNGTFRTNKCGFEQPVISLWVPDDICIQDYEPAKIITEFSETLSKRKDACGFRLGRDGNNGYREYRMSIVAFQNIASKYGIHAKEKKVYENGSYQFTCGLLRGFFDTDGSVQGNHSKGISIRLSQADLDRLKAVQRMLLAVGIFSTIYENRYEPGYVEMPDGNGGQKEYYRQALHELVISRDAMFRFADIVGFSENNKAKKLNALLSNYQRRPNQTKFVSKIVTIDPQGKEDVYDCTINTAHCFSANGMMSHNCAEQGLGNFETCCLGEIFLPNITSIDELFQCARYIYRICKHSLTLPCADSKETERIVHRNMRMGIGISGYLQATDEQRGWLSDCYKYLRSFDKEYSRAKGFPVSIKLCTVKPSGCSRKDMLILTTKGLLRLDEIGDIKGDEWQAVKDLQVFTDQEKTEYVTKFYVNGTVPTRIIRTEDGNELESSLEHKYRIVQKGKYIWKKVEDLEIGDMLVTRLGDHPENIITKLNTCDLEKNTNCQVMKQPDILTKDIAWFLGLFYGNGSVHKKGVRISFNGKQPALLQWLDNFFSEVFGLRCTIDDDHSLCVNSQQFLHWLDSNKCLKDYAHELCVPKCIRTASKENVIAFIDGFWRADGDIHNAHNTWSVCTVSEPFAREIFSLCRSVGYNIKMTCAGPAGLGSKDRWILHIRKFEKEKMRYVSKDLKNRIWGDFWLDPIVGLEDSSCETFDIEVENAHHYRISGTISHNTLSILANCTPGIHPGFARFYKRRVRIASESALIKLARDHGYHVEYVQNFDGSFDHTTQIVTFPMSLPGHTIFAENCSAIQQLEWVKKAQTEWSDNSVSVTVYYRKQELPAIKEWLKENYNNSVKTVSFLLHSDHGFKQAPMEQITQEEYEKLMSECRPIVDLQGVCYSSEDNDVMANEKDCSSGACPRR